MNYRWLVIMALVFVTACNSSTKEEVKKKPAETQAVEKTNPAADLTLEYQEAYDVYVKKIREAKPSERAGLMKANPQIEFAEQFRALAAENVDSEIEGSALAWIATNSDIPEEKTAALATLMEKYTDSPVMKDAAGAIVMAGKPSKEAEENLRSIMKNSPHLEARGAAAHQLVSYFDRYKSLAEQVDELAENPRAVEHFGEDGLAYIRNLKVDDAEIESLYETIVSDYSDVVISQFGRKTNIGDAAKNALF